MSNESAPASPPKPRRRWLRRLAWGALGCLLLLVAVYFFATSFTFLKMFVLPRASQAVNGTVTLEDASISPFSKVTLRGLKVQTSASGEPLLAVREIRARYSLMDIIGGHINIAEVTLDTPVINLIEDENGGTNLDPLLKSSKGAKQPAAPAPAQSQKPPQVNLQSFTITNATIRHQKKRKDGGRDVAEVSNVNLTLSSLGNAQTGHLGLGADISSDKSPVAAAKGASERLEAKLSAAFDLALTADLKPQSIHGKAAFDVTKASEALKDLAGLGLAFNCDVTPTEIKQCSVAFAQRGTALGQIAASGPLDMAKQEGKVKLEISAIDRRVLNLAGAALGMDFGPTTINATHEIVLANGGQFITTTGRFAINQLSITQKGLTTKPLDFQLNYNVAVNQADKSALVNSFTLTGTQNQAPLLSGTLARPMKLSFGAASNAVEESAFDLALTNFNLADWRAFVGDYAGKASFTLNLLAQQAGKNLKVDLKSRVEGLAGTFGSNRIERVDVVTTMHSRIEDFNRVQLEECAVNVNYQGQPALVFSSGGRVNVKSQEVDLQTAVEVFLPKIAALLGNPEFKPTSGKAVWQAQIGQRNPTPTQTNAPSLASTVKGSLKLEDVTGDFGTHKLNHFDNKVGLDLALTMDRALGKQVLNLDKCQLTLLPTARAQNELSLTGKVDLSISNAISGDLQLAAESLDLTAYYDVLSGSQTAAPATTPPAKPAPPPAGSAQPNVEPAPMLLPLGQFTFGVNIGRFYLREIDITRWLTTAKLDRSNVVLKPFQLVLNGAPVNATVALNLGVPGYQYDLGLAADKIPLEPIANTFMPQSRGQYKGDLLASAQIKGAGVTGTSLQKNLGGQLAFSFTNASLQIASPTLKAFFIPIGVLVGAPDLLNSPLNWLGASAQMGGGKINLTQFNLVSDTFSADTQGDIKIADVLMNSPLEKWPMHFYLQRTLAERIKMLPKNTPPDAAYAKLPDFIKVAGTLGAPKAELNAVALGSGVIEKVIDKTGLKEKAGGLLDLLNKPK